MRLEMREGHEGTGPGAITPDGCAVELYSRLPVGDEPEIIAAAVPRGAHILELGSGVGRMTHAAAGARIHGHGGRRVGRDAGAGPRERARYAAAIEDLDLGETFDVVLLASFLVHAGDPEVRRGLLRTCARHLAEGGRVLIQREGADYHTNLPRERVGPSGSTIRMVSSEPVGDGVNSVRAEYEFPDAVWTQTFLARPLTPEQFEEALGEAGLRVDRYLTEDGVWVRAVSG